MAIKLECVQLTSFRAWLRELSNSCYGRRCRLWLELPRTIGWSPFDRARICPICSPQYPNLRVHVVDLYQWARARYLAGVKGAEDMAREWEFLSPCPKCAKTRGQQGISEKARPSFVTTGVYHLFDRFGRQSRPISR